MRETTAATVMFQIDPKLQKSALVATENNSVALTLTPKEVNTIVGTGNTSSLTRDRNSCDKSTVGGICHKIQNHPGHQELKYTVLLQKHG